MPKKPPPGSDEEAEAAPAAPPPDNSWTDEADHAESLTEVAARHGVTPDVIFASVLKAYEQTRDALQAISVIYTTPVDLGGVSALVSRYLADPAVGNAIKAIGLRDSLLADRLNSYALISATVSAQNGLLYPGEAKNTFAAAHDAARAVQAMDAPLRRLSIFQSRVESAAVLMSCAFAEAAVTDFKTVSRKASLRPASAADLWYAQVVNTSLDRFRDVRNALVHAWTPTPEADVLASEAFLILADLTSAKEKLVEIHVSDPARARSELVHLLDPIAEEIAVTARLLVADGAEEVPKPPPLDDVQAAILAKAGATWSLSDAADALGISRQALHKRVIKGTVLGVMRGRSLAIPCCQFEQFGVKSKTVTGLGRIIALFRQAQAGDWSALQFLVEPDPNLVGTPIAALRAGKAKAVESAARAYLSLDEG